MSDFDVVVIGAGISGISAAHHLMEESPDRSFVILEGREDIGGTWDLFRYPGVRSDSDMHTLGYSFKPWTHPKSIADGPSIMEYLRETVGELDLDGHIRFGHRVTNASWSSEEALWTITHTGPTSDGSAGSIRCSFLFVCAGYYSYDSGYTPDFKGIDDYTGTVIHPQEWPDDFDHAGKRIVVIGSGATAVTLVPALAGEAAHVTMLQRSPTWMAVQPDTDWLANGLRRVLPDDLAYRITRRKNILFQQKVYSKSREDPEFLRKRLRKDIEKRLPDHIDFEEHFLPDYDPWDQRLCLVPNGDLFTALTDGSASMVTEHIDRFTAAGILLRNGETLEADVVITATGLQLVTLGEIAVSVDGQPIDFAETFTYKGLAYSGVPNLVSTFGYINASWTLRADLISRYVCRLLNHMRRTDTRQCMPTLRPSDVGMERGPLIADFPAGYMMRMMPLLPKQGDRDPWTNPQELKADIAAIRDSPIDDGVMTFS